MSDDTLVRQRTKYDCGIACVAMALEIPYETAAKIVTIHDGRGAYCCEIAADLGRKWGHARDDAPHSGDIVNVSTSKHQMGGHFVFMVDRLNAYDPHDGEVRNIDHWVVWDFVKMREAERASATREDGE